MVAGGVVDVSVRFDAYVPAGTELRLGTAVVHSHPQALANMAANARAYAQFSKDPQAFANAVKNPQGIASMARDASAFAQLRR